MHRPFVQQLTQLPEVTGRVGQIGQPVQCGLVTLIGQPTQGVPILTG
ncbi:hypothetical protein ACFV98_36470 [Streptomyces violascens]